MSSFPRLIVRTNKESVQISQEQDIRDLRLGQDDAWITQISLNLNGIARRIMYLLPPSS